MNKEVRTKVWKDVRTKNTGITARIIEEGEKSRQFLEKKLSLEKSEIIFYITLHP